MFAKLKFFFTNIKNFIPYILFIFILTLLTVSAQSGWRMPITLMSFTSPSKIHPSLNLTIGTYLIYLFVIPYAINYLALLCKKIINKDTINQMNIFKESASFYFRELALIILIYIILIIIMTFTILSCTAVVIFSKTISATLTIILSIAALILILFILIFTIWLTPATLYLPYKNTKVLQGLEESIKLGRKNFWKIVGISFMSLIPILIAAITNLYILYLLVCSIVGTFIMFYICTLIEESESNLKTENKEQQE